MHLLGYQIQRQHLLIMILTVFHDLSQGDIFRMRSRLCLQQFQQFHYQQEAVSGHLCAPIVTLYRKDLGNVIPNDLIVPNIQHIVRRT